MILSERVCSDGNAVGKTRVPRDRDLRSAPGRQTATQLQVLEVLATQVAHCQCPALELGALWKLGFCDKSTLKIFPRNRGLLFNQCIAFH